MKESIYFNESEFQCKHCGKLPNDMPPDELIEVLTEIREHFKAPVIINSGYRCKEHNAKVGGAPNSRHTVGDAADFVVSGVKTEEVYNYVVLAYGDRPYGIAIKRRPGNPYGGFVHLDTRGKKARWEYK